MLSWLANPLMLGWGMFAVSLPIIIHLLNKRRFKIVDWAAMEFLLEADKKNRRRVKLENLILLLLRCLAMFLIGLLLARPFVPSQIASVLQQDRQYERVILLDDSLSNRVLNGGAPAIDVAKNALTRLIGELANSNSSDDWLTVFLTSRPEQPLLANEPISVTTLPALSDSIQRIESTFRAADYSASLNELRRYLGGQRENVGRVVYFLSDMRERDWTDPVDPSSDSAPNKLFNQIGEISADCFLVDMAGGDDGNLAITDLRPLDLQIANKVVRFRVEVSNFGRAAIGESRVILRIDDSAPQHQTIPSLAAGQTREVVFPYMFPRQEQDLRLDSNQPHQLRFRNYRVVAELDRQSLSIEELRQDQLLEDSTAYFAARIQDGIPILLVDGDPLPISERSETHYLKSLAVLGTGLAIDTVTAFEFENIPLTNYRAIFLCNVDEVSTERIATLKQWIQDGGNLVLMPGNKVRSSVFNQTFYEGGKGISPLALDSIEGDPTMSSWVNFETDPQIHPSLEVVIESDSSSLSKVDVFSWWTGTLNEKEIGKSILVPLRLSNQQNSPAMVERSLGTGTIVVFTIPADGDWTMWPSSATFAPVMIDLIDYLVGTDGENSQVEIGGTVSLPVELSAFDSRVTLRDPNGEKTESIARPIRSSDDSVSSSLHRVQFDDLSQRGFYEVEATRHSGEAEVRLFASNVEADEGRLHKLSASEMEGDFFDDKIQRISVDQLRNDVVTGGNTEVWPQVLVLLIAILATEQFLGWWFGRRR
jgi:hypothetical protein